jgi:hypothetical protein
MIQRNLKKILKQAAQLESRSVGKKPVTTLVSDDGINAVFRTDTGSSDLAYETVANVSYKRIPKDRWLSKL